MTEPKDAEPKDAEPKDAEPKDAEPKDAEPEDARSYTRREVRESWAMRRRRKIREEVARNRRGEHTVPTWVLAVLLVAVVTGWILFIALV